MTDFLQGADGVKASLGGGIDVVNNYSWTTVSSPAARALAPTISLQFFQQTKGRLTESINRWYTLGVNSAEAVGAGLADGSLKSALVNATSNLGAFNPQGGAGGDFSYEGMYLAENVGSMVLPFMSEQLVALNNSFSDNSDVETAGGALTSSIKKNSGIADSILNKVENIALAGAAAVAGTVAPGMKLEKPKAWAATEVTPINFTFTLYNTIGSTKEEIAANFAKNNKLVHTLIYLSSIQKFGPGLLIPPVLVEYNIPNIRYGPVASMSVNIQGEGAFTNVPGIGNMPDAYNITITLTDELIRSRNFHTPDGPRTDVKVFTNSVSDKVQAKVNEVADAASEAIDAIGDSFGEEDG